MCLPIPKGLLPSYILRDLDVRNHFYPWDDKKGRFSTCLSHIEVIAKAQWCGGVLVLLYSS